MRLATWNVNSHRIRHAQVLQWIRDNEPDVLALQEIKLEDPLFPHDEFSAVGYGAVCRGQKTYNGVAILARHAIEAVACDLPNYADDQRRVIAATVQGVRVVNVYVPNGQRVGSEKYDYKLRWLAALRDYLVDQLAQHPLVAVMGDFNIAPADIDVYDPDRWRGKILCSDGERERFQALRDLGLEDCYRLHLHAEPGYTWWDYRTFAFRTDAGLRIDHILASPALAERCTDCIVDVEPRRAERPSDHAPVIADFA